MGGEGATIWGQLSAGENVRGLVILEATVLEPQYCKQLKNIWSMLAVYTLSDLVSNYPKLFVINFVQVYYQIFFKLEIIISLF